MAKVVDGKTLLTYSDYVQIPEDGQRHEIIEGQHYVTPSPITRHQRISRHTHFQLYEQIELAGHGEVFDAPTDVLLSDIDIVVPDIFVILAGNASIIGEKNIQGAPDLVVEITSPSTKSRDLKLKRLLYEKRGVPEYWVILVDEDAVEKFVLERGAYVSRGKFRESIGFDGLAGVCVDLTRVW